MLLTHMSLATLIPVALAASAVRSHAGPVLAPAGFDCKTRHLAMEYARKIQPFRSASDFRYLAEVLDMHGGTPGGPTQCFNVTYDGPDQVFAPTFPIASGDAVFYADSVNGKDSNPVCLSVSVSLSLCLSVSLSLCLSVSLSLCLSVSLILSLCRGRSPRPSRPSARPWPPHARPGAALRLVLLSPSARVCTTARTR
eukprot:COSAG03_NODE_1548_length_3894_cov_36.405007_2_plen_197_part_00